MPIKSVLANAVIDSFVEPAAVQCPFVSPFPAPGSELDMGIACEAVEVDAGLLSISVSLPKVEAHISPARLALLLSCMQDLNGASNAAKMDSAADEVSTHSLSTSSAPMPSDWGNMYQSNGVNLLQDAASVRATRTKIDVTFGTFNMRLSGRSHADVSAGTTHESAISHF